MSTVEQLVGEFVDAWNAGRRPGVDTYLALAKHEDRDELAAQLSAWLQVAPTPDFDEPARTKMALEPRWTQAREQAEAMRRPLAQRIPTLRERAGLAVRDVAPKLNEQFGLGDAGRVEDYLLDLESGVMDERRLSQRLLDGLASILGVDADALTPSTAAFAGGQALFRADEDADLAIAESIDVLSAAAFAPGPDAPMDELDRLFRGGPGA